MFNICVILLIVCAALHVNSDVIHCGKPGRPSNGTISPLGSSYFPGEKVTYGCIEGFVLFGEETRTCQKNGSWSGKNPLCDFNLAKEKRSLQSDTLWSYSPDLAVDGNADTCSFTPRSPEPRWWQVHLGHKFNIVSVGVTISPGSFQEFTIYVIELLEGNKALYKPCTTFKGVFQTHKGMFKCNDGIGHPGQFVYVRDDRKEEEYFGLCEVEVFAYRDRIPCGDPEVPVKATATNGPGEEVNYTCVTGFKLEGNPRLICLSKGKWQGDVPKCNEVKCSPPIHIENGYIEIGNSKGEYVFGTKAKYGCSPGHHLTGIRVRTCSEDGTWSGEQPSCQAVSCGPPPKFPNTRYTLINGSNQWTGIAVYTCEEGFTLRFHKEDTVTTCLDNGEWKFVNVTCIPLFVASGISRLDHGRAINYEIFKETSPEYNMPKLVIALAIIAGVLATSLVIMGSMMVRKRLLLQTNSNLAASKEKIEDNHESRLPAHFFKTCNNVSDQEIVNREASSDEYKSDINFTITTDLDHNYETLGKSTLKNVTSIQISTDCDQQNEDKQSIGYEVVGHVTETGYETLKSVTVEDESQEKYKENDYETLKEKDPGYETIKDSHNSSSGYEVISDMIIQHGYETIKPQLPPPNSTSIDKVPDILQNLHLYEEDILICTTVDKPSKKEIPPQILDLYAKIDKSKKKKKINDICMDLSYEIHKEKSKQTYYTESSGAKGLIQKFNSFSSEEGDSPLGSMYSDSSMNSIRPLPPIPHGSK